MATRLYFNTGHAADLSLTRPLPGGGVWETNVTSLPTTRRISTTTRGTANNASSPYGQNMTIGNGTNPNDILYFQGISGPLAAQTISGTITGVACFREANASDNLFAQLAVFVVDKSGARVATLWGGQTSGGTEFNSPSANTRYLTRASSQTITSYDCADGDRIVVEVGVRTESTRTNAGGYAYIGDPGGGDLGASDGGSNNLTLTPWIEFSDTLVFGYTETGSFTADAIVKKTQTGSFTMDAFIASGTDEFNGAFAADAVIRKPDVSGSFTIDAILSVPTSGSFTVDAWKSALVTGSFTFDAVIQDTPALIEDNPFDEPDTVSDFWHRNWTLIKGIENSTAEHGRSPSKGAFIYDNSNTVLDSERGGYITRRTYQKGNITARIKLAQAGGSTSVFDTRYAVYLRHSGETGGLGFYNATYVAVELIVQAGGSLALQIRGNYNSVLYGPVDVTSELGTWSIGDEFYLKGWVKGSRVKGKVWRVGDPEPRPQINRNDIGIQTGAGYKGMAANTRTSWKPVEWDVRRVTAYNLDYSVDVDAVIQAIQAGSFTAGSILKKTQTGSFTMDAVLSAGSGTGSFTADAIVKKTTSGSFAADSVLKKSTSASFSADAVKKASASGAFSLDAMLGVARSGSFTLDAIRLRTASLTFTLDAVLKGTRSSSFTLGAVLKATNSTSFTLDARLRVTALVSFTADAILQREQQSSATVDAIVRKGATGSFSAGALLLSPRTGSFTLDALAVARRVGSFAADAVLANTISGSFSLDAVLGLAVLPDIDAEVVIRMIEAETSIHQIDFQSTLRMIEAETSFTGG